MATIQVLTHLTASIELAERAEQQARALAATFRNVVQEIDAVVLDADLPMATVLAEKASGTETQFSLRAPVYPGSVKLFVNEQAQGASAFAVDSNTGALTLARPLAKDARVRVEYVALGLRSQMEPLAAAVGITIELIEARKARYLKAIQWITENFGA